MKFFGKEHLFTSQRDYDVNAHNALYSTFKTLTDLLFSKNYFSFSLILFDWTLPEKYGFERIANDIFR